MATRTAVAGDDFNPRKLIALLSLGAAGVSLYKKATPIALASVAVALWGFFSE